MVSDTLLQLRVQLAEKLADWQRLLPQESSQRARGEVRADLIDSSLQSRIVELHAFLDLFDRSPELRKLLSDLIDHSIQETEQRLLDKLDQQEQSADSNQQEFEKR